MFVSPRSVVTGHPTPETNVPTPASAARIPEHDVRAISTAHHSERLKQDNVRDHRAGTSNLNFKKHAQVRLRVHHIVIPRFDGSVERRVRVDSSTQVITAQEIQYWLKISRIFGF